MRRKTKLEVEGKMNSTYEAQHVLSTDSLATSSSGQDMPWRYQVDGHTRPDKVWYMPVMWYMPMVCRWEDTFRLHILNLTLT